LVGSLISTGIATRVLDQSCAVSGLGGTELPEMFFLRANSHPENARCSPLASVDGGGPRSRDD